MHDCYMRNFEMVNTGAPGSRMYISSIFFWVWIQFVSPLLTCQDVTGDAENLRSQFFFRTYFIPTPYLFSPALLYNASHRYCSNCLFCTIYGC